MSNSKRILLLGSILLIAALVFTFSPMSAGTAAAATYSTPCPPTQNTTSNDTWVQVIQFVLNADHFEGIVSFPNYPLPTNGNFDSVTTTAVHDYQTQVMKIAPGAVGDTTWASMGFCDGPHGAADYVLVGSGGGAHCPGPLSEGSSGIWVQALQSALNVDVEASRNRIAKSDYNNLWWPLALDGNFGVQTATAVDALQQVSNISIDGSVGNQTWGSMGMCYT